MRQEYLTLQESTHLLILGVDPNDASHCVVHFDDVGEQISGYDYVDAECSIYPPKIMDKEDIEDHTFENDCPIFTVMDVIKLCPATMKFNIPQEYGGGVLKYKFTISGQEGGSFKVGYMGEDDYWFMNFCDDELARCLYRLLVELIEKKYITL